MALRIVRLGSARQRKEGLRIGVVRRPPRGVRKSDYARRNYYDVWLPELAPSQKWVSWALSTPWTDARWAKYARNYQREMRWPDRQRLIEAGESQQAKGTEKLKAVREQAKAEGHKAKAQSLDAKERSAQRAKV